MKVTCQQCGASASISDPGEDGWYGVGTHDDEGNFRHVEKVTWKCEACGASNDIYRDEAKKK